MKNLSLFLLFALVSLSGFSQPTYDQNSILDPTVETYTLSNALWQDLSSMTGPNMTYDFSDIEIVGEGFVYNTAEVEQMEGASYFDEANHAFTLSVFTYDSENFMNVTPSSVEREGYYIFSLGIEQYLVYDDPVQLFSLPMTFGDSGNDSYSGSIYVNGMLGESVSGVISYEVAGFGTIMLPGDIEFDNCLMVVSNVTEESVFDGGSFITERTLYEFYVPGVPFLIASFEETSTLVEDFPPTVTSFATVATSMPLSISQVKEVVFDLYPNPATDQLFVKMNSPEKASVEVRALSGALILQENVNGINASLNVSELSTGVYLVKVQQGDAIATRRLIIQ